MGLPIMGPAMKYEQPGVAIGEHAFDAGPRVLVLEDDPSFRAVVFELLADEGFEVVSCESYAALREAARDHAAPVVVADFWGSSHAQLSECEREQITNLATEVPTILLTGRAWAWQVHARDLGLVCILTKPLVLDELLAQVRRGISLRSASE